MIFLKWVGIVTAIWTVVAVITAIGWAVVVNDIKRGA